jgi:hypothetical protein
MSTANPPPAAPTPVTPTPRKRHEIVIVSHSSLFYWWPIWAVGFVLAIVSYFWGERVALVPEPKDKEGKPVQVVYPKAKGNLNLEWQSENANEKREFSIENQDVLVTPPQDVKHYHPIRLTPVHMAVWKEPGVIFLVILLLVIFITNVPMRGLWSVIVVLFILALVIFLALVGALQSVLNVFTVLDVRISVGGYLVLSTVLFGLWLLVVLLFDRQIYMVFSPGQLKVRLAIGDAETVYDTTGMTFEKQRSDLFRHWILGLGSGDLIIRTAGAQGHHFDFANVLFLGRRVREIEEMMRERPVVSGQY